MPALVSEALRTPRPDRPERSLDLAGLSSATRVTFAAFFFFRDAMPTVPKTELDRRHERFDAEIDALSLPIDVSIVVQKADLYYLSGTTQQAHLLVARGGRSRLLVRKVLERAQEESALGDAAPLRSLKELRAHVDELAGNASRGERKLRVGMELDVLSVSTFRLYEKVLGEGVEIVDVSPAILAARSIKSEWEIEQLRAAASVHDRTFGAAHSVYEPGMSTFELQTALDARAAKDGHCGIIRMRGLDVACGTGVVVSGEDGAVPSHSMFPIGGLGPHAWVAAGGSRRPIERDTPVILDYLMSTSGYHADCTRMAVAGAFPDEAATILAALADVLRSIEAELRPGAVPSAIYASAVERAHELGVADAFMGPESYSVPFVGHSVGLEVNEAPVLAPRFRGSARPRQYARGRAQVHPSSLRSHRSREQHTSCVSTDPSGSRPLSEDVIPLD